MKHTSIKMNSPIEFVNITSINPLISRCQIKVCYVSDKPNRNKTVINKDLALEIAQTLPGSPIVGYYNEASDDFEEHNKFFEFKNGKLEITETTRPYGFVDVGAKVWFQKFLDDNKDEREYLMTEGYLWTGQYPECNRVMSQGNNQSLEFDEKSFQGFWSKSDNGIYDFFIINEAIISKLCILGEDYEPCFEGATIGAPKIQFSLGDSFKTELYSMITELSNLMKEGGAVMEQEEKMIETAETAVTKEEEEKEEVIVTETEQHEEVAEEEKAEGEVSEEIAEAHDEVTEEPEAEKAEEEKPESNYSVIDSPEYQELLNKYTTLETNYNQLVQEKTALTEQINSLNAFKLETERKAKQEMIDSFYMLSEEEKQDVVNHIDTYSLDDIESKLSVIYVRKNVDFASEEEHHENVTSYNLNECFAQEDNNNVPDWVLKVRQKIEQQN